MGASYTPVAITESRDGLRIAVRVMPGAPRNEVGGTRATALVIRTTAQPERGKANAMVVELLAAALHLPKSAIELVGGLTSRNKQLIVRGVGRAELAKRLSELSDTP